MDKMKIEAIDVLDRIIIGRVYPHVYAFTTNTVPNYLKVGDTYRSVSQRLNEWRVFFPELEKQYEIKLLSMKKHILEIMLFINFLSRTWEENASNHPI